MTIKEIYTIDAGYFNADMVPVWRGSEKSVEQTLPFMR